MKYRSGGVGIDNSIDTRSLSCLINSFVNEIEKSIEPYILIVGSLFYLEKFFIWNIYRRLETYQPQLGDRNLGSSMFPFFFGFVSALPFTFLFCKSSGRCN